MTCPIEISFRDYPTSEGVEHACWRASLRLRDLPGISDCRLRIEGGSGDRTSRRARSGRVELRFRLGGHEFQVEEPVADDRADEGARPVVTAVRDAVSRGWEAATRSLREPRPGVA
jgi:hypothetical protein